MNAPADELLPKFRVALPLLFVVENKLNVVPVELANNTLPLVTDSPPENVDVAVVVVALKNGTLNSPVERIIALEAFEGPIISDVAIPFVIPFPITIALAALMVLPIPYTCVFNALTVLFNPIAIVAPPLIVTELLYPNKYD